MEPISFARGLLNNIGVKLIALVVAAVIWFNASSQQTDKRNFIASLRFVNLPDSVVMTGLIPTEVEVSVEGTRRELLFLGFRKMVMTVNMARTTPGRFRQRLAVSDMLLPPGVESGDVRVISPTSVDVRLEHLVTRRQRVSVTLTGRLPPDLLFSRLPEATPAWVKVTGPESLVAPLNRIPTRSIDLGRIRESVVREVVLDYDRTQLACEPDRVSVSIQISARGTRVLANVPPTILVDEKDHLTEVTPKTVSLTLEGPRAMLDTLSSGDVSVLVDLSGKPPGRYTLAPEIIVPSGVERFVLDVDSLEIVISKASRSRSM